MALRRVHLIFLLVIPLISYIGITMISENDRTADRKRYSAVMSGKFVSLTFDDGPVARGTDEILDILKKENVKATFFLVGKMIEKYPDKVLRMHREGHEVANHTYSHENLTTLSRDNLMKELNKTRLLIKRITGKDTNLFRPPGGQYNNNVIVAFTLAGYKMILWTNYPVDYGTRYSYLIHQRVISNLKNEDIILLHNGVGATIQALPQIIADIKKQEYEFVTVSTLIDAIKQRGEISSEMMYGTITVNTPLVMVEE